MRPRHVAYAAPLLLGVLALIAGGLSPAGVGVCMDVSAPGCDRDPTWLTYSAYVLWGLALVALVVAVVVAAYHGVRRFLRVRRLPAVPPERHDVIR